jgi:putative transcriptional regulator
MARSRPAGTTAKEPEPDGHDIACHLDRLLEEHGMTLTELAARVGVTVVNLSVLKNNRAKAIRFSTLSAICAALDCQPGDLLTHHVIRPAHHGGTGGHPRL